MRLKVTAVDDLTAKDFVLLAVLVVLSLGLYGVLTFRLAQGSYLDYNNFAFDFDPADTVGTFAGAPADSPNVKHPLVPLLRPLAWPLLAAGLTVKEATGLVIAGFGSATAALCFVFLRKAAIERPIAAALTLLFMVTGTQIFTSIITETYGIAGFSIVLTWVIANARVKDASRYRRLRYAAGVLTFGTTVTNVVQTFIAEMLVAWTWQGFVRAIRHCIVFGIILSVPILILVVALWHSALLVALHDPVHAIKDLWWQQTKGPRTAPGQVPLTFFIFSFVSPKYSWLMLPEGINMRDFREYAFPFPGQIAAPLWLAFCGIGIVAGFAHSHYRVIASGIAVALVCNLLFHLDFQFRGSLYLYAAHMHFLIFALSAGLAPWVTAARMSGKAYIAVVLLLAILVGADNLPIASAFVTDFDNISVPCAPPCADKSSQ